MPPLFPSSQAASFAALDRRVFDLERALGVGYSGPASAVAAPTSSPLAFHVSGSIVESFLPAGSSLVSYDLVGLLDQTTMVHVVNGVATAAPAPQLWMPTVADDGLYLPNGIWSLSVYVAWTWATAIPGIGTGPPYARLGNVDWDRHAFGAAPDAGSFSGRNLLWVPMDVGAGFTAGVQLPQGWLWRWPDAVGEIDEMPHLDRIDFVVAGGADRTIESIDLTVTIYGVRLVELIDV